MARHPKPFFRKQTRSWYVTIGGRQIPLGKDRQVAFDQYHELMRDRQDLSGELTTLYQLSQAFLTWVQDNRAEGTYKMYLHYLKSFIGEVGKRMWPRQLKVHHLTKWIGGMDISTTSQNDAIAKVQRMLNWSVERGYLVRNPIAGMKKPKRQRRDVFYTPEQWEQIRKHASPPFDDFLDFLYSIGCRPKEARELEARYVNEDLVIFPIDQSEGEIEPGVIYLTPPAQAIVERLASEHSEGPIFRNSKGRPWDRNSVKCRLTRKSDKVGFRCIAYGARHSWATQALAVHGIDPITAGHLMGHRDATQVARTYSHISKNSTCLREQARKAMPVSNPNPATGGDPNAAPMMEDNGKEQ